MKISFDNLIIERVILELRFEEGFLYWDNCGRIWRRISALWGVGPQEVSPERAVLVIEDEGLQIKFGPNDLILIQEYPPKALKVFKEVASKTVPLVADLLEIDSFTRVGNRILYIYPTNTLEEASKLVRDTGLINISDRQITPFGTTVTEPTISFRTESQDLGYQFSLSAISRKVTIKLPKPFIFDESGFSKNAVLIDIDYYTRKNVDVATFDPQALLETVQENLRRNLKYILSSAA